MTLFLVLLSERMLHSVGSGSQGSLHTQRPGTRILGPILGDRVSRYPYPGLPVFANVISFVVYPGTRVTAWTGLAAGPGQQLEKSRPSQQHDNPESGLTTPNFRIGVLRKSNFWLLYNFASFQSFERFEKNSEHGFRN